MTIFMIHKCSVDETILELVQQLEMSMKVAIAHNTTTYVLKVDDAKTTTLTSV